MTVIKCEWWYSTSSSGGKIWGCPVGQLDDNVYVTFNAPYSRFKRGLVTINEIKKTKRSSLCASKEKNGYMKEHVIWVDVNTGKVFLEDPNQSSDSLEREILVTETENIITINNGSLFNF